MSTSRWKNVNFPDFFYFTKLLKATSEQLLRCKCFHTAIKLFWFLNKQFSDVVWHLLQKIEDRAEESLKLYRLIQSICNKMELTVVKPNDTSTCCCSLIAKLCPTLCHPMDPSVCRRQKAIMYLENEQMGLSQIVELPGKQEEKLNLLFYFMEWQAYRFFLIY